VSLRNWTGWFQRRAVASANSLEPLVWNAHEKRIRYEKSRIAANPEEYEKDYNRVDAIFDAWIPSVPKVAEDRINLKTEWDKEKPVYLDRYAVKQMFGKIHYHPIGA
ncbi:MAG: hypothetical protein IKT43_04995, partial [Clostridia bacterium]|nr:hypothetical protein [Clostridia bacterium]